MSSYDGLASGQGPDEAGIEIGPNRTPATGPTGRAMLGHPGREVMAGPHSAVPARTGPAEDLSAAAWRQAAPGLADWAMSNVVVRTDAYGSYRERFGASGTVAGAFTRKDPLTRGRLIAHFRGDRVEDRVCAHLIDPDDSTCRLVVIDIDAHDANCDPEPNWAYARRVAQRAESRGAEALVLDSDGRGGFHVWIFLGGRVEARQAWRFGKWLVHDWAGHIPSKAPESFPKQPALTGKRYGNFIRLPGRHHRRLQHWTRVWDGSSEDRLTGFLGPEASIRAVLRAGARGGRSTPLVPPEFRLPEECVAPRAPVKQVSPGSRLPAKSAPRSEPGKTIDPEGLEQGARRSPRKSIDPEGLGDEAVRALDALERLGAEYYDDYEQWLRIGLALRNLDEEGLAIWHHWSSRSAKYEPDRLDEKWMTFEPAAGARRDGRGCRVGLGTLFHLAGENGWKPPRRAGQAGRGRRTFTIKIRRDNP